MLPCPGLSGVCLEREGEFVSKQCSTFWESWGSNSAAVLWGRELISSCCWGSVPGPGSAWYPAHWTCRAGWPQQAAAGSHCKFKVQFCCYYTDFVLTSMVFSSQSPCVCYLAVCSQWGSLFAATACAGQIFLPIGSVGAWWKVGYITGYCLLIQQESLIKLCVHANCWAKMHFAAVAQYYSSICRGALGNTSLYWWAALLGVKNACWLFHPQTCPAVSLCPYPYGWCSDTY